MKDYVAAHAPKKPFVATAPSNEEIVELNKRFVEENTGDGMINMMMSMYMVGAMEFFDGKSLDEVRKTAMEIAMIGVNGINPQKKSGYEVKSVGRVFGGYQLLAYYYVSFKIAYPELLPSLQLPFDEAYEAAEQIYNARKK